VEAEATLFAYNALANQQLGSNGQRFLHADAGKADASGPVVLKYDPLVEDAQRELFQLGVYKGGVDGVNGLRTRQAIQQFQQMNGLPATGEITEDLVNNMKFTRKIQAAAQFTGSTGAADNQVADQTPLAPKPVGTLNVKKVQVVLAGLGYDISTIDGEVSPETRAAILKFEMDNGLDMNGAIDGGLLKALKIQIN
jgi:peptidoglycan hydrolase-like protein with peptidoglycan-binding domain